jgi:hypothetical protein
MTAQMTDQIRDPAVAGSFYPGDPDDLRRPVAAHLAAGKKGPLAGPLRALVVPHAGYVYSGEVAASGYNQINPARRYERVFILALPTPRLGQGLGIRRGDYRTPLGSSGGPEVSAALAKTAAFSPTAPWPISRSTVSSPAAVSSDRPEGAVHDRPIVLGTTIRMSAGGSPTPEAVFHRDKLFIVSSIFPYRLRGRRKTDTATAEAFAPVAEGFSRS